MNAPASTVAPPPRPWLLADIGGTHARFGWLAPGATQAEHVDTLATADHAGPAPAAATYLQRLTRTLGAHFQPARAAAFAVATAVGGDRVEFTNSGWSFSRHEAARALQLDTLLVLNDFEALALALPGLSGSQLQPFGGGRALPGAARAVIGPGTGLGVAGLLPAPGGGWLAVPGEGGHATLAAMDDFEAAVLAVARREHGHVSAERLLSGIGLPTLHAAVGAVMGARAPALSAEQIVASALADGDAVCGRTVDAFCALLGSFAGNVALTLGARGGVYIGGGVVPHLGPRFFASSFRQRFEDKGRFRSYLQAIPTALITDTLAALGGAARALEQHRG